MNRNMNRGEGAAPKLLGPRWSESRGAPSKTVGVGVISKQPSTRPQCGRGLGAKKAADVSVVAKRQTPPPQRKGARLSRKRRRPPLKVTGFLVVP